MRALALAILWTVAPLTLPVRAEPSDDARTAASASKQQEEADRRDGIVSPRPPLCDGDICDRSKPFRFSGGTQF